MNALFSRTLPILLGSTCIAGFCFSGGDALAECTFTGLSGGSFAQPAQKQGWLEAANAIGGAGTSATATINCTVQSSISDATIQHNNSPPGFDFASANARAIIRYTLTAKVLNTGGSFSPGAGSWGLTNSSDFDLPINTDAVLDVSLAIGFDDTRVLPAGNYSYTVTLTATSP
jgi:hypothetical protein